ncbi:DUF3630 family protein [Aliiglaciecola sp. 3_MG-2023]|uniref:DUF3630 family protein n=1 Tax=Aliiglaciecola sp. 3_MG-2023 TaxID=3062644 RepID=UPI0026E36AE4|nr:DUF3630 family protein [Aliiglaciecola sp. 3_MG-2023]MDO6695468.1 DUF3630 family protein [Aliiglaciecola sp. 3_MG-2023]
MLKLSHNNWRLTESTIILICDSFPTQAEVMENAKVWLDKIDAKVSDISEGADRAQIQFVLEQDTFLLCYDATCEAIWIEVTGFAEINSLSKLLAKLDKIQ